MTDKEYKQQKKRTRVLFYKWLEILGLRKDRVRFHWHREIDEESPRCVASVNALWQYRNHIVNVYLPEVLKIEDEDELEDIVIHELTHILLHPITGDVQGKSDHEIEKMEFATTSVAYAIKWAYQEKN